MDKKCVVEIEILKHGLGLSVPEYATPGSSGVDLRAALEGTIAIEVGARVVVPTGLKMKIPEGFEGQIRSRSGMVINYGLVVLNAPGTLDSDHLGEIKIILANLGSSTFELTRGFRCAQLVICPVTKAEFKVVNEVLDPTSQRQTNGFGSTGSH